MAIKLPQQSFIYSSSPCFTQKPIRIHFFYKGSSEVSSLPCDVCNPRKRRRMRHVLSKYDKHSNSWRWVSFRERNSFSYEASRIGHHVLFASTDDGVTVNGTPQTGSSSDVEEMRVKLRQSLEGEDYNDGLIQSLHDASRVFELAIREQSSLSKIFWFSTNWLGVDRNAWMKALSYQAAVFSLLQAVTEISSRGEVRDRDINIFVQRSLLRLSASLESLIKDELSAKQPEAYDWFWSDQLPIVVTTFVNHFERDPRFTAAITVCRKGLSEGSGNASDISLLMLVLTCIAAITKLGPAKVSCSQFISTIPDITGRLMDMLVDFIPIHQTYHSIKDIGLRREFLVHFGPRAATCIVKHERGTEEMSFWVDLIQKQLQRAIDRERIWSRLTTCETIEVLEKDLAIFGFFIALGRSSRSFLLANGFDVLDDPVESLLRYLIGGSVLYYPQLSSISSYQLYVEVVCEELEWLPFFPSNVDLKQSRDHKSKREGPPNEEAIPQVLQVCSYWMQGFIKYSNWLENPSNIKAARFLSRGHNKLKECMEELGVLKNEMKESNIRYSGGWTGSGTYSPTEKELDSFDKALESVEEALKRLEELLQELHLSSSDSGKEHLQAACSDLERIRKLKKEAEFLEASFRAKAASLQQGEDVECHSEPSTSNKGRYPKRKIGKSVNNTWDNREYSADRVVNKPHGMWSFLEVEHDEMSTTEDMGDLDSGSNEFQRFELLRHELFELEKRVQKSTDQSENEEEIKIVDDNASYDAESRDAQLFRVQKKESIIGKSIVKLKEASTDVWQGTQLLAIDVAAAVELLRRALIGDELTEKEKKALRRTLTDLASVVPIGILMLLPVTAVGHAAMLAAIQRYVPALIPSTYGPERLDLLRQLEKVKEIDTREMNPDDNVEENSLSRVNPDNV
ncbi:uncharacterized protein LOC122087374 isoform X2 [Macadamia integrifolia]|uniref:uncharacterized protein LOC122087374 isoform X2 n=1 Tax=Macadamia integrifolia TaxID=60698 RepID=UPI001C4FC437|nr:uncharacterized protein LOC122087374 isoform X2 [Macadamia integrifolia]